MRREWVGRRGMVRFWAVFSLDLSKFIPIKIKVLPTIADKLTLLKINLFCNAKLLILLTNLPSSFFLIEIHQRFIQVDPRLIRSLRTYRNSPILLLLRIQPIYPHFPWNRPLFIMNKQDIYSFCWICFFCSQGEYNHIFLN